MEGGTHTHTHSKEQTHTDTQTHTLLHIVRSASVRLRGGYGGSAKKKVYRSDKFKHEARSFLVGTVLLAQATKWNLYFLYISEKPILTAPMCNTAALFTHDINMHLG